MFLSIFQQEKNDKKNKEYILLKTVDNSQKCRKNNSALFAICPSKNQIPLSDIISGTIQNQLSFWLVNIATTFNTKYVRDFQSLTQIALTM